MATVDPATSPTIPRPSLQEVKLVCGLAASANKLTSSGSLPSAVLKSFLLIVEYLSYLTSAGISYAAVSSFLKGYLLVACGGLGVAVGVSGLACMIAGAITQGNWSQAECDELRNAGLLPGKAGTRSTSRAPTAAAPNDQKIGLLEFDTIHRSDVANWLALFGAGATLPELSEVPVDGGVNQPGPEESEVLLDIDTVMSLDSLPGTSYVVYDAPPDTSFQTMFNAMVNDGDTVISNSWSECEDEVSKSDADAIDSVLQEAEVGGVTVLNGTGDTGSTCLDGAANTIGVPADSPHATAVGGSSPTPGPGLTYGTETWWNGTNATPPTGQGGYGVSRYFSRPSFQNGFDTSSERSVPDVVADADPAQGMTICEADAGGCPDGLYYGGTSMATPEWAAFAATLNETIGHDLGDLDPLLYPLASTDAFHPPTALQSDFAHVGLGSVDLPDLELALSGKSLGSVSASVSFAGAGGPNADGTVPADGSTSGFVRVGLNDAAGIPVAGKTVTLTADASSDATITPSSVVTASDGSAVFYVTDATSQAVTFRVEDETDGITLDAQPALTFVPPSAAGASIVASEASVQDNGKATSTIIVYLENALDEPASGKTVSVSEGGGQATITPVGSSTPSATAVTNSAGIAEFKISDTTAETVELTAVDVTDGDLPVPGTAEVTFSSGSPPACPSKEPTPTAGYTISTFATGLAENTEQIDSAGGFLYACQGVVAPVIDDAGSIYASDIVSGGINVFGPAGGKATAATALPDTPFGPAELGSLVFAPNGDLYAGSLQTNDEGFGTPEVVQLDPTTGAIERVVANASDGLSTCPVYLAVDPKSGNLFATQECSGGSSQLSEIDTSTGEVTAYADPGPGQQLVFAPDGTLFMVQAAADATSATIDEIGGTHSASPGKVTQLVSLPFGADGIAIRSVSSAGEAQSLYVTGTNGEILSVDLTKSPAIVTKLASGGSVLDGVELRRGCLLVAATDAIEAFGPRGACSKPATTGPEVTLKRLGSFSPRTGGSVSFDATVTGLARDNGTPIYFTVEGANSQEQLVDATSKGTASFHYAGYRPGDDVVTAFVVEHGSLYSSQPITFRWLAGKQTTSLSLEGSPQDGRVGKPARFKAALWDLTTMKPISKAVVTITLGKGHCAAKTSSGGKAFCSIVPKGAAGTWTVSARYAGNASHTPASASSTFDDSVPITGTTRTTVRESVGRVLTRVLVTFRAVVKPSRPTALSGTVTFFRGEQPLGKPVRLIRGVAVAEYSFSRGGLETVTAHYNGSRYFGGSISRSVTLLVQAPGFRLVAHDGGVFDLGGARFYGSLGDTIIPSPIEGMASLPNGLGYWLVASNGSVYAFGGARLFKADRAGSPSSVVAILSSRDGRGYWLIGSSGQVWRYGDAARLGEAKRSDAPIVGAAETPGAGGYWLVNSKGDVQAFGDARIFKSAGRQAKVSGKVTGIAATIDGKGYYLVNSAGRVLGFGDAKVYGSARPRRGVSVVGIAVNPRGGGYWLATTDGHVYNFGSAPPLGSVGKLHLHAPICGVTSFP